MNCPGFGELAPSEPSSTVPPPEPFLQCALKWSASLRALTISDEDREMAIKMMSKRQKRLYDRAMFGKNRKSAEVDNLKNKAKAAKRARVKS